MAIKLGRSGATARTAPVVRPQSLMEFAIWACVRDACDASTAQNTAEVFMRECAAWGYPFSESFTLRIPSTVEGDHFPVQYNYKDFGKGIRAIRPYGDNTGMALMIIPRTHHLGLLRLADAFGLEPCPHCCSLERLGA